MPRIANVAIGNGEFELTRDVHVRVAMGSNGLTVVVPAGFITDFASIPVALHWFIRPSHESIMRAAIVHDWLYSTHQTSRGIADAMFEHVMRLDGMPRRKAKLCRRAVNTFGKSGYLRTSPDRLRDRTPWLYAEHFCTAPPYEMAA